MGRIVFPPDLESTKIVDGISDDYVKSISKEVSKFPKFVTR